MDHNSYYTFLQFWALNWRIVERILRIDVIVESEVNSRLTPIIPFSDLALIAPFYPGSEYM